MQGKEWDYSNFPKSNVDRVVEDLILGTKDLTGEGLVNFFEVLFRRAQERRILQGDADRDHKAMLEGSAAFTQSGVTDALRQGLYTPLCQQLFLAVACRRISQELEFGISHQLERLRTITEVTYSKWGEVEGFTF